MFNSCAWEILLVKEISVWMVSQLQKETATDFWTSLPQTKTNHSNSIEILLSALTQILAPKLKDSSLITNVLLDPVYTHLFKNIIINKHFKLRSVFCILGAVKYTLFIP